MSTQVSAVGSPTQVSAAFYPSELGPTGTVRGPLGVTLLSAFIPFYGAYWMYFQAMAELKTHLRKSDEELSPGKDLLFAILTLGIAGIFHIVKIARLIAEAHGRAGRSVESKGTLFVVVGLLFPPALPFIMQRALNDLWEGRA
jgi:hypothetical protein